MDLDDEPRESSFSSELLLWDCAMIGPSSDANSSPMESAKDTFFRIGAGGGITVTKSSANATADFMDSAAPSLVAVEFCISPSGAVFFFEFELAETSPSGAVFFFEFELAETSETISTRSSPLTIRIIVPIRSKAPRRWPSGYFFVR